MISSPFSPSSCHAIRFHGIRNDRTVPFGDFASPPFFQSTLSKDTAATTASGGVSSFASARMCCTAVAFVGNFLPSVVR